MIFFRWHTVATSLGFLRMWSAWLPNWGRMKLRACILHIGLSTILQLHVFIFLSSYGWGVLNRLRICYCLFLYLLLLLRILILISLLFVLKFIWDYFVYILWLKPAILLPSMIYMISRKMVVSEDFEFHKSIFEMIPLGLQVLKKYTRFFCLLFL